MHAVYEHKTNHCAVMDLPTKTLSSLFDPLMFAGPYNYSHFPSINYYITDDHSCLTFMSLHTVKTKHVRT